MTIPAMTIMTPWLRKFALTAHVASSVGSLGAVVGFLALAIAGLTSQDAQMVRAAYLAMQWTAWFVILPFMLASLLTGLVSSLGTTWGLFRHYWVLVKFVISTFAIVILLMYLMYRQTLGYLAGIAADATLSGDDFGVLRSVSPLLHAVGGLLLLLVATVLAVYKPQGMTSYGARKTGRESSSTPRWVRVFGIIALVAVLLLVILIVSGGHGPVRH
jgi:hypothetical protein